jgi:hypothetical protein
MPIQNSNIPVRVLRRLPLAACLVAALNGESVSSAQTNFPHPAKRNAQPTATHSVDTCADDNSPNSLRTLIAAAGNGDTIDFANLPMGCSKITLDGTTHAPAHIDIDQDSLQIVGPGSDQLSIDGNFTSSILRHHGSGTLEISGLTIANGKYVTANAPKGGCIYTKGNVALTDVTISRCVLTGTGSQNALGAGVYAHGYAHLLNSKLAENRVSSTNTSHAFGGGIYVIGNLDVSNSTISANVAEVANAAYTAGGGGIFANSDVVLTSSTISGNQAAFAAGLSVFAQGVSSAKLTNSTVSGNRADAIGGIFTNIPLELANSTIVFNHSTNSTKPGGVFMAASGGGDVITINSSIVAANRATDGPNDVGHDPLVTVTISGSHNLINSTAMTVPIDTIGDCAQLDPLLSNGGPTETHALRYLSPAIEGGNAGGLLVDQRGYQRVSGVAADIGAFEWQGEIDERITISGFELLCDQ